jgi:hypothetical protein
LPGVVAVKVMVAACIPAAVGLPRNHRAEPGNEGAAVIIGMAELAAPAGMMTRPWAMSASALTISMVTRAPAGTLMARKPGQRETGGQGQQPDSALRILDARLAWGEIDADE